MKSLKPGNDISDVEIVHISAHGVWVSVGDQEYFLPYTEYPWFKNARIEDVLRVEVLHGRHLHWPNIDVDLEIESLGNPAAYPLISK